VIAESGSTVRTDVSDSAPQLWFPRADVRTDALAPLTDGMWTEGAGELADHIAFDHERVDLALVDARPGDDERDVTTKRFPTWGDASDLVDVMDVRPEGDGNFTSPARSDWRRPVIEGS
jgi:hypothetical protein